jgi:polyphosphate glucokinase
MTEQAYGIDFGGSGIKGAPVDLATGEFAAERNRIPTPEPATPEAVVEVIDQLVDQARVGPDVAVGVTVPAVVRHGVVESAANIDDSWIDVDAGRLLHERLGRPVAVLNDADAAGLAEVRYGAAAGRKGLVIVATLGTGIGTALVHDGVLVPNAELGHLEIDGYDAESRASSAAREREDLGWEEWAVRLTRYFGVLERLFSPDLIVIGGGVSKRSEKFLPMVDVRTPLVPAALRNTAGIVGAALVASQV